ncbi:unnamed protein product [Bubo scandiacus]
MKAVTLRVPVLSVYIRFKRKNLGDLEGILYLMLALSANHGIKPTPSCCWNEKRKNTHVNSLILVFQI